MADTIPCFILGCSWPTQSSEPVGSLTVNRSSNVVTQLIRPLRPECPLGEVRSQNSKCGQIRYLRDRRQFYGSNVFSAEPSLKSESTSKGLIFAHGKDFAIEEQIVPIEHQNVPEGHRGLHDLLYSSDEVHGASNGSRMVAGDPSTWDDGKQIVPVQKWLQVHDSNKVSGVFAVYGSDGSVQYIGISRDIALSLRNFSQNLDTDRCASVRVQTYKSPRREALDAVCQDWIETCGVVPPGNGPEAGLWDPSVRTAKGVMTEDELAAYEETKFKLRKAMGESTADDVVSEETAERRANMMAAVEQGDWSGVINRQTAATVSEPGNGAEPLSGSTQLGPVVSPFASGDASPSAATNGAGTLELTEANVDKVLDEVRPVLIADGGNVSVRGLVNDTVYLRLEGACGSCPSSQATMKMGIERTLRERFPTIQGVVAIMPIEDVDLDRPAMSLLTVEMCLEALDPFIPAIAHVGGKVEIEAVNGLDVFVKYGGPEDFKEPISSVLKDKLTQISNVVFVD